MVAVNAPFLTLFLPNTPCPTVLLVPFGAFTDNTLSVCDLSARHWSTLAPRGGVGPSKRFGQTMIHSASGNCIFVFGGTDGHEFYNDLFRFDLETLMWEDLSSGESPHGR